MDNKKKRKDYRHFGTVRELPSGRYQVRYRGPDGRMRPAPRTFARKREAERYLSVIQGQIAQDDWTDPQHAKIHLRDYAEKWLKERPGLSLRTHQLYEWLLTRHILPHLGDVELGKISTPLVREWRTELLGDGVSETVTAKAYRLLRSVLMTAVNEDRILSRNPCRIRGADKEKSPERPVLTVRQVFRLADMMKHNRYRALILLGALCSLRWGEVTALRRCDVAEDVSWVRVTSQFVELAGRGIVRTLPKSRAGVRTIAVPAAIRPDVLVHLDTYVKPEQDALLFTGLRGRPLRRGNFNPAVEWKKTVTALGVPQLHFHDLRHTGNTLAAATGASIKDLMVRMGHDSAEAALVYQHATSEADRRIAAGLSALVDQDRDGSIGGSKAKRSRQTDELDDEDDDNDDGSAGALVEVR
jgi:integrase